MVYYGCNQSRSGNMDTMTMKNEIKRMKEEKNAVILAHYYQEDDVQDVADYIGDSLHLSQVAAKTNADVIVFCGVHFMAETAKILSPEKVVLLPAEHAGCPMANMVTGAKLARYKEKNPDVKIVCYVNSTAEVKALSDVCVTSTNAERIIKHLRNEKLMYVPDKNLGTYVKDKLGMEMEVWPGFCCIHNELTPAQVDEARKKHPEALVLIHPEAPLATLKKADFVGSTRQIAEYAGKSDKNEFIVGTEKGILYQMRKNNPDKLFHLLSENLSCYDMKMTSLEDVYNALKFDQYKIEVPEDIRIKAYKAVQRMMDLS